MNINYKYSTLALAIVALLTGCGAEDNKDIGGADNNIYAPIIKGDVTIPALHVGLSAKGAYQYFDPNPSPRPEGASLYSWRDANEAELSTEQTLELTYDMLGDNVKFCVIPVAQGTVSPVGDEECSDPRIVNDALGEKPLAENVLLDNTAPIVGGQLTGSYDYSHSDPASEGNTTFVWKAAGNVIVGEEATTLAALSAQTEGKAIEFCVVPVTNETTPVRGSETCSAATDPVLAKLGSAPEAQNVAITGAAFVGSNLTGSYDFHDDDGDLEGATTLVWKRDDASIPNATTTTYLAVDADENTDITYCVTPISATGNPTSGTETCSAPKHITKKVEDAPVAANVTATVQSGGIAEAGEVLVSNYDFQHVDATEGDSVGHWVVDGAEQGQCATALACEYPITQLDVGKTISFSVTPYTSLGTAGTKANSADTAVMGIKISGALEYDQQLTAVVHGYDGDVTTEGNWLVDALNQDGPAGDSSPVSQEKGSTYTIGTRAQVTVDSNTNNIIDDYDWIADGSVSVDARNFVGKSVQFCLDTTSYGQKCVSAADSAEVTGGLYFDGADKSKRAIEPIRLVTFGSFVYHRPLTAAEAALKADAGFGANIPDASETMSANGIEWARFAQIVGGNNIALNSCRNLYADNGDWHLPLSQFSAGKYIPNFYAADGNTPPSKSAESMIKLAKELVTDKNDIDYGISPVYGWPIGGKDKIPYGSASRLAADTQNYNVVRFYSNGSSANNYTAEQAPIITCVKP